MKQLPYFLIILITGSSCMWNDIRETREKAILEGKKLEKELAEQKRRQQELTKIETIKLVFDQYVKQGESTDSESNKALMKTCLESIDCSENRNELAVLIDVWLYYDPTDFPTRELVFKILEKSKPLSTQEVQRRMTNPSKTEDKSRAPFSELRDLLIQLKST